MNMDQEQPKRVAWNKGLKTGYAPWLGKKRGACSEETKAKMSAAHMGRKNTALHNQHIAEARRGTKWSPETIEKIRQAKLAHPRLLSDEEKQKLGLRWLGRKNPAFGTTPKHGPRTHWVDYNGVSLRSSWEVRFAKALDRLGMKWEYEPKRFDLGEQTYMPDFYVPSTGAYWEVKGWFSPKDQKRIARFREVYPEIHLVVATQSILEMMERTSNNREQFGNAMKLTSSPNRLGQEVSQWRQERGRSCRSSLNGVNCGNPTGESPWQSAAKLNRDVEKVQRLGEVLQTGRTPHERAASFTG